MSRNLRWRSLTSPKLLVGMTSRMGEWIQGAQCWQLFARQIPKKLIPSCIHFVGNVNHGSYWLPFQYYCHGSYYCWFKPLRCLIWIWNFSEVLFDLLQFLSIWGQKGVGTLTYKILLSPVLRKWKYNGSSKTTTSSIQCQSLWRMLALWRASHG